MKNLTTNINKSKIFLSLILFLITLIFIISIINLKTNAATTNVNQSSTTSTPANSNTELWESNTGTINLGATITSTGNGISINGSTVTINKGGDFEVKGTLSNGMIKVNTADKCKLRLNGCNITNSTGPAICIENANKAFITLVEGSTNTLSDGKTYSDQNLKATLFSNDDLEIKGNGKLSITGNYKHAIASDDDIIIENGIISVSNTVKDAINANAGIKIKGGTLNLNATRDCIQSGTEQIAVEAGTLNLSAGSQAFASTTGVTFAAGDINVTKCKEGVEAKSITVNGGNIKIISSDDSFNATSGKRSEQNDGSQVLINNGNVYLSGANGDPLDSNGSITIKGGNVIVHGPQGQPEVAIDSNGPLTVSGGMLIAAGTNSFMTQYPNGTSNQYSIAAMLSQNQVAGSIICIKDSNGKELVKFKPDRSYYSIIFSAPDIIKGSTYSIYTGGSVNGGTNTNGLISGGSYSGGTVKATIAVNTSPTTTSGNFSGGFGGGSFNFNNSVSNNIGRNNIIR